MASVSPPNVLNIADLRRLAQKRLPRVVFDYIDGGAEAEVTLRDNARAYEEITFRPKGAVVTPQCDLRTTIMGTPMQLPFVLGPIGSSRMFYPHAEEAAAKVAGDSGIAYILSTLSGTPMEEVKAASKGPVWYQVYLCGGRRVATAMLERVRAAGFTGLVITIDTAVSGMREKDFRNGIKELIGQGPSMLPYLPNMMAHPRWLVSMFLDGGLMKFPNVILPEGPMAYADVSKTLEDSAVSWDDLKWIRQIWSGPIMVKGVHTSEDARRAVGEGADALSVSNHGGRQLDGVPGTLRILPEVVEAVNGQIDVLVDGGIRRGSDIAKALCLGARAVLIGRAYAYGLAAAGEAGVARAVEILRADLIRTMKLLGVSSVADLNESYINVPEAFASGRTQRYSTPKIG